MTLSFKSFKVILMRYYYLIANRGKRNRSTSFLRIHSKTADLSYNEQGYLTYSEPIPLLIRGEETESNLYFPFFENSLTYIDLMVNELKSVFERFNMPSHRWYKAEAGYDLEFIKSRKKFFKIEYDIDLNEKREYWILQLLKKEVQELDFPSMNFNIVNVRTKHLTQTLDGPINNYDEYLKILSQTFEDTDYKDYIDSPKYIYRKNYDILWGGTHIVFNEKVKAALEATNIITADNGLEFAEFTDYEIEMLGEMAL
jgi:hypothetical protein